MRYPAAIALALVSVPALAIELTHDDEGAMLDASGFYKNQLFGLVTPTGAGAISDGQIVRLAARFRYADRIEAELAYQLQLALASDPAFAGGGALTTTIGGTGPGPQRRLVPLSEAWVISPVARAAHEIDRLLLRFPLPFGDLTVGRQVLSWGTGRFFNPTDVLSPFPPTAVDREVRRGFDAVRLAVALGDVTQLDLVYLPQVEPEENGGVVRFQTNIKGWDGSLSAGKYVRDFVFGFDLVGDIGPIGVHAEGAYTLQWVPSGIGEHFFRGVIGADARPHEKLVLTLEYFFNGYGSTDPSQYARILSSPRALRGEVFTAGKHEVAAAASLRVNDLLSGTLSVLCNVTDPSALVIAAVEYSFTQSVLVRGGAYVPLGRPPVVAEAMTPGRGLRSEYGSGPFGAFAQVGLYVP